MLLSALLVSALAANAAAVPVSILPNFGGETSNTRASTLADSDYLPSPWYWVPVDCDTQRLCNGEMCTDACIPGTVRPDAWTDAALSFERSVQAKEPLVYIQYPSTHNTAISQAYGMGIEADFLTDYLKDYYPDSHLITIANQRLSTTDQLNIGVRHVEVDIYGLKYISEPRVCHWPTCPPDFYRFVSKAARRQGDSLDWDCSNLGCSDSQKPTFESNLEEIRVWLDKPENSEEFVYVYLDNRAMRYPDEVMNSLEKVLGDVAFTPTILAEKYGGVEPSISTMLGDGFRAKVEMFIDDWAEIPRAASFIFDRDWAQFGPDNFEPFPKCTVHSEYTYGQRLNRAFDGSLTLGPATLWEGRKDYSLQLIRDMTDCGINFQSMDQITPFMMKDFVWSWAENEFPTEGKCARLNASKGRWENDDCQAAHRAACRSSTTRTDWVLSETASEFAEVSCPDGYEFGMPTDGHLQRIATERAREAGVSDIWVNYMA